MDNILTRWFTKPKSRPLNADKNQGTYNPHLPAQGPMNPSPTMPYNIFKTAPRAIPMRMLRSGNDTKVF